MGIGLFTATLIFVLVAQIASVLLALIAAWIIHAKARSRASLTLLFALAGALLYTLFDLFLEKAFGRYVNREHPDLLDVAYLTIGEALPALVWLVVAVAFVLFARSSRAA